MMPTVTKNLIIINVLVFFGTIVAQRYGIDLANYLGLHFFLASDFQSGTAHHLYVYARRIQPHISLICLPFSCSDRFSNKPGVPNVSCFTISFAVSVQDSFRKGFNIFNT